MKANTFCYSIEKFIIDQELISRAIRVCEGVDTSDAALSLKVTMIPPHLDRDLRFYLKKVRGL